VHESVENYAIGAGGNYDFLDSGTPNVASLGSPRLGQPNRLTLAVWSVDNASTFTVFVSYDKTIWVPATLRGTATKVSIVAAGSGDGLAVEITPAPYVRIHSSAACKMFAWAYISN